MTDLDKVLGFDRHIAFLTKRFLEGRVKRLAIRGPSGTGKTSLAKAVSVEVIKAGCGVVWLPGDPGRTDESLYPLRGAVRPAVVSRIVGKGARVLGGLADDFLPAGRATSKALFALLPQAGSDGAESGTHLSDIAHEFSSMLARLIKRQRVLLIADDIQYFDAQSLKLLQGLIESPNGADAAERGLLTLLATINTDAKPSDGAATLVDTVTASLGTVDVSYCTKAQFGRVLVALGLTTPLPESTTGLLHDCSGGHLHIANFIVDELRGLPFSEIGATAYSDLLHYVIQRRLGQNKSHSDLLLSLLCSAAHIGRHFAREELTCLTGLETSALRSSLHLAEALRFVEVDGGAFRFSHEIIRSYFLKRAHRSKSEYAAKYSECLRILRPHDYYARCISLLDADSADDASVAYCQGLIAEWRSGHVESQPAAGDLRNIVRIDRLTDEYLNTMREAHALLAEGDFRTAKLTLSAVHEGIHEILVAERDYLLAEALLKDLGVGESEEARRLLNEWDRLKDLEPELWCRMRLLLLLAHVQLGQYDQARQTERGIITFLARRGKFDYGAEKQLNRLLALSEMHSSADISRKRIAQACEFYERLLSQQGFADLYEYFICLTNRAANAITIGDYGGAIQYGTQALIISRDYPMIRLPAKWAAANNAVVGAVFEKKITPSEGADCLRELIARFPRLDDDLLINSNIGSLEVVAGNIGAALEAFGYNADRLESTPDIDPYYRYLSESNRAIALQLAGEEAGKSTWNICEPFISSIAPAIRSDLALRHRIISQLFNQKTLGNQEQWRRQHRSVVSANPRYRADHFLDGVFLTDIQIWSSV